MPNIVNWFEIPVSDFDRAKKFYNTILDQNLEDMDTGMSKMGVIPEREGVSGAIVYGEGYVPSEHGALIYLNGDWSEPGGRLRLLRGPDDIEDMIAEVPPVAGTLIAFQRTANSWHGHKSFSGVRRAIMLNWMTDAAVARRELRRHAVSSGFKRLFADG